MLLYSWYFAFCVFLHSCWYFCTLTFPLLAPPVRLTDLTPAGKTAVAPKTRTLPPKAPAAPRAHGQSFSGGALSFSASLSNYDRSSLLYHAPLVLCTAPTFSFLTQSARIASAVSVQLSLSHTNYAKKETTDQSIYSMIIKCIFRI